MRVLAVNAGSSSLKLSIVTQTTGAAQSQAVPASRGVAEPAALREAIAGLGKVDAVGHRIVHGGTVFTAPVLIDTRVRARLESLTDLAPLHQPASLAALDVVSDALPGTPAVACFDTAFHARMPPAAATYALPPQWRQRWSLRRYGFHGLSHAYCSRRAAELAGDRPGLAVVSCHLGAGASLAAVRDGRSLDTTMGFTPLEGLVMATRSGSVDPGLVLWLEEHAGTPPGELAATLEHRSGLLGLAGTADMRLIIDRADAGDPRAARAFDVYIHRLRASIAAMAAALGGIDVLAFTGGVGENAPRVRERAADGLEFLGIAVDPARNTAGQPGPDFHIGASGAPVATVVIAAREDLEIAAQVRSLLTAAHGA